MRRRCRLRLPGADVLGLGVYARRQPPVRLQRGLPERSDLRPVPLPVPRAVRCFVRRRLLRLLLRRGGHRAIVRLRLCLRRLRGLRAGHLVSTGVRERPGLRCVPPGVHLCPGFASRFPFLHRPQCRCRLVSWRARRFDEERRYYDRHIWWLDLGRLNRRFECGNLGWLDFGRLNRRLECGNLGWRRATRTPQGLRMQFATRRSRSHWHLGRGVVCPSLSPQEFQLGTPATHPTRTRPSADGLLVTAATTRGLSVLRIIWPTPRKLKLIRNRAASVVAPVQQQALAASPWLGLLHHGC
jgi:hypothetical protein